MIAMAAVLLLSLCELCEVVSKTDILLNVDDRSWASTSAQDCVNFCKNLEHMERSTWPQGKRIQGEILP